MGDEHTPASSIQATAMYKTASRHEKTASVMPTVTWQAAAAVVAAAVATGEGEEGEEHSGQDWRGYKCTGSGRITNPPHGRGSARYPAPPSLHLTPIKYKTILRRYLLLVLGKPR